MTKELAAAAAILLRSGHLAAQGDQSVPDPLEYLDATEEAPVIVDDSEWLRDHPLDLNAASAGQIAQLPGVSLQDALLIGKYRESIAGFTAAEQLFMVPDLETSVARRIIPYVTVPAPEMESSEQFFLRARTRTSREIELSRAYTERIYEGSPFRNYLRVDAGLGEQVQAGLLAEKDAGEVSSGGFVSGYAMLENQGFLRRIVIGDYRVEIGQGVALWEGAGLGKGGDPVRDVIKRPRGLVPHHSTDEFNFMRGVGVEAGFEAGRLRVTSRGFYSYRRLAASTDEDGEPSTYYEAGLFRTASEYAKKDRVAERVLGGSLGLIWPDIFSIEGVAYRSRGGLHSGSVVAGVNVHLDMDEVMVRSEFGGEAGSHWGWMAAVAVPAGKGNSFLVQVRNYPEFTERSHTSTFGERDGAANERGVYIGFRFRLFPWLTAQGYLDVFRLPYRTTNVPFATEGADLVVHAAVHATKNLDIAIQYVMNRNQADIPVVDGSGRGTTGIRERRYQRFRLTADRVFGRLLRYRFRTEGVVVGYEPDGAIENGMLLYHDVRLSLSSGMTIEGRVSFFATDSYDSRIYAYENDVRGVLSIPPLFGRGKRWYCLVRYVLFGGWTISARYSETTKDGSRSLGTGLSEIPGDTERFVVLQADLSL